MRTLVGVVVVVLVVVHTGTFASACRSSTCLICVIIWFALESQLTKLLIGMTRLEMGSSSNLPSMANPDITPNGVARAMNSRGCGYHLRVLRLFNNAVDDLVINIVSQRCHVLEELYIQDSPSSPTARETEILVWEGGSEEKRLGVSTRGIYLLMNGVCRLLRRLQLVTCDLVGYDALVHLINAPPNALSDIQFRACKGMGTRAMQLLASSMFGQQQLKRFSLCCDACSVTLDGVGAILRGCTSLQFLEVRQCKLLPPLDSRETQAMLGSCAHLPPALEWCAGDVYSEPPGDVMAQ
jgi:hypothetical protein